MKGRAAQKREAVDVPKVYLAAKEEEGPEEEEEEDWTCEVGIVHNVLVYSCQRVQDS